MFFSVCCSKVFLLKPFGKPGKPCGAKGTQNHPKQGVFRKKKKKKNDGLVHHFGNQAMGQNLRYLFGDGYPPKVVYFKGFWDVH